MIDPVSMGAVRPPRRQGSARRPLRPGRYGRNEIQDLVFLSSLTPSLADGPARRGKEQGSGSQGRTGREEGRESVAIGRVGGGERHRERSAQRSSERGSGGGLEAVDQGQEGVWGATSRALRRLSRRWVRNRVRQDPNPGARAKGRRGWESVSGSWSARLTPRTFCEEWITNKKKRLIMKSF